MKIMSYFEYNKIIIFSIANLVYCLIELKIYFKVEIFLNVKIEMSKIGLGKLPLTEKRVNIVDLVL